MGIAVHKSVEEIHFFCRKALFYQPGIRRKLASCGIEAVLRRPFELTRDGGCIVADNKDKISSKELRSLLEIIQAQFFLICAAWKQHFKTDSIKFYC